MEGGGGDPFRRPSTVLFAVSYSTRKTTTTLHFTKVRCIRWNAESMRACVYLHQDKTSTPTGAARTGADVRSPSQKPFDAM